jgi:hypothetical protein
LAVAAQPVLRAERLRAVVVPRAAALSRLALRAAR